MWPGNAFYLFTGSKTHMAFLCFFVHISKVRPTFYAFQKANYLFIIAFLRDGGQVGQVALVETTLAHFSTETQPLYLCFHVTRAYMVS